MAKSKHPPRIVVLAGVNGAGKSSIAGARLRASGVNYFNPDEATRRILDANPTATLEEANSAAWHEGKRLLEEAIDEGKNFAFETTLGGQTIKGLLKEAIARGFAVHIWHVGLRDVELHIRRVRERVARGGHDIPEDRIRSRYDSSRLNLIELLPGLTELSLWDNSAEMRADEDVPPRPRRLLHVREGEIVHLETRDVPHWAKPIMAAAIKARG